MRKFLLFAFIISTISAFSKSNSNASKVYIGPGDTLKVILSIKHNDRNISTALRTALSSMSGVNVVSYCDNHALFMLFVDKTILRDNNDLMTEIKKIFPKSEDLLSFKDGDFNQFIQYCSPTNINDAANLKKLITN